MVLDQVQLTFINDRGSGIKIMSETETYEGRKSKTARLLDEFKEKKVLTTRELYKYGTGCSSRLNELRKEDHDIFAEYIKQGQWRYTYRGEKE